MSEEIKVAQRYQWIKSEKTGNVVEVDKVDKEWTYFKGGSRISTTLLSEFMLPLEGDALPLTADLATVGNIQGPNVKEEDSPHSEPPIRILFDKQAKNDKVKLKMQFQIEVPKIDIYNIIKASFDEKEVRDELKSFILNQLKEDDILDSLHQSVEDLIEERYKGVPLLQHL